MLGFVTIMVVSNMTHSSFWLSTESHYFVIMTALMMASASRAAGQPIAPRSKPVPD
jgi:O-antigen ligase